MPQPEHDYANQVLEHWPDRDAMADAWRALPGPMRARVGDLVRMQAAMIPERRYCAWCWVRPHTQCESEADQ